MTKEQAKAMLKAKRECIELDTKGNAELCDRNCGECELNYEKGNMGEQKEALDIAIKALEQQPFDCKIFGHKENCIGETYDCDNCDYKIQAIQVLNTYYRGEDNDDREFCDAIDMAIKSLEQQPSDDCVSREQAIKELKESAEHHANDTREEVLLRRDRDIIRALPPVTPTHGTCKDCKHSIYCDSDCYRKEYYYCKKHDLKGVDISKFYCADFEKRGNENGSN